MRPIDADALEEIVQGGIKDNPHKDGFARVCHRTEYTHFLDVIRRMPTITQPPNDPLTLEELREMDGEPVWITDIVDGVVFREQWALIFSAEEGAICFSTKERGDDSRRFSLYGTGWLAYRRKPEWGKNDERK